MTAFPGRGIEDLLNAVHVGSKGGHENSPFGPAENALESLPHCPLGRCVPGPLRVSRIRQEAEHAILAQLGKGVKVGHLAVVGGLVKLEVAAVHNGAHRRMESHRDYSGYAVVDMDELHIETAHFDPLARADFMQHSTPLQPVLDELHP